MKILFLSFYYPPDLCAGSFRTKAIVDALLERMPRGHEHHIDLMTTMPNRYNTFLNDAPTHEYFDRLSVYRAVLPPHKSGIMDQSWAFGAFARQVLSLTKGRDYDLVVATSSRLMTAALGSLVSRIKRIPLYLDIRDIYLDTINDILPKKIAFFLKLLFSAVEGFTMRRAEKINLVSEGFRRYFSEKYPKPGYSFFTNGIDDEFLTNDQAGFSFGFEGEKFGELEPCASNYANDDLTPVKVLYAGNIGEGQGLHAILPELARRLKGKAHFRIIGDGGRKKHLEERIQAINCSNIELIPPMDRDLLIKEYMAADVLFLHLHAYEAFKKVLPSKIFEYASTGKPIWAGVAGYSAEFIKKEVENAAVFPPCDVDRGIIALGELELTLKKRTAFVEKYRRKKIMDSMAADIVGMLE